MGSIYRPRYKDKKSGKIIDSQVYWIKYYKNGKSFRESSKSKRKADAEKLLKLREGQIVKGEFYGLQMEKTRLQELANDYLNDYILNGRKSLGDARRHAGNLLKVIGDVPVISIHSDVVLYYIKKRLADGLSNSSINRELTALKRMFSLAMQTTPPKVTKTPRIPHLKEAPPRKGFFEYDEYLAIKAALPSYLRPVITMAYYTGMRKGEILNLKWEQVDLTEGKITLYAGTTKNDEGRVIFMPGELLETLKAQKELRDSQYPQCEWVFFGDTGKKICKHFRGIWLKACNIAGLEGKLFHDFRRTGVRNLIRSGTSENVTMKISGHKTRSILTRYDITDEGDLKEASLKIERYIREKAKIPDGQSLGKVSDEDDDDTEKN